MSRRKTADSALRRAFTLAIAWRAADSAAGERPDSGELAGLFVAFGNSGAGPLSRVLPALAVLPAEPFPPRFLGILLRGALIQSRLSFARCRTRSYQDIV